MAAIRAATGARLGPVERLPATHARLGDSPAMVGVDAPIGRPL